MSNSWIDSGGGTGIYCDADADNNLLQLKLKKPKSWKWELTTSRSSPNIALPRIMLFDHKGTLLVDANQQVDDAVYRAEKKSTKASKRKAKQLDKTSTTNLDTLLQEDEDTGLGSLDSAERQCFRPLSNDSLRSKRKPSSGFRNAKKGEAISVPYEIDIDSLQICEATDSNSQSPLPVCEIVDYSTQSPPEDNKDMEEEVNIDTPWRRKLSLKTKYIESSELSSLPLASVPIISSDAEVSPERQYISQASWKAFHSNGCLNLRHSSTKPLERRATSFKEVRFNIDPETVTDKGEEQKLKRRCRRSNTNGLPNLTHSRSILERQSAMKCRFSSPEFDTSESHEVQTAPRYFLRTCRAGTLVVAEEPGRYKRTRRRAPQKTSSTENVLSHSSSSLRPMKGVLNSSLGDACSQSQSVKNFGEYNGKRGRRKVMVPIRRNRSDGNILLATSTEEENCDSKISVKHRRNALWRHKNEDVKNYSESNE